MDYLLAWLFEVLSCVLLFLFDFVTFSFQFPILVIRAIVQDFLKLFFFFHFSSLLLVFTFHKVTICALLTPLMLFKLFHALRLCNHHLVNSRQSYFLLKILVGRIPINLHPCSQINYSLIVHCLPYQKDH